MGVGATLWKGGTVIIVGPVVDGAPGTAVACVGVALGILETAVATCVGDTVGDLETDVGKSVAEVGACETFGTGVTKEGVGCCVCKVGFDVLGFFVRLGRLVTGVVVGTPELILALGRPVS